MSDAVRDLIIQLLVGAGGLALIGKAIAAWWARRCALEQAEADRRKDDLTRARDELRAKDVLIESLQVKVYSMLVDAAVAGKEDSAERAKRLATDDKLVTLIEANISALTRYTTSVSRLEKGPGHDSH